MNVRSRTWPSLQKLYIYFIKALFDLDNIPHRRNAKCLCSQEKENEMQMIKGARRFGMLAAAALWLAVAAVGTAQAAGQDFNTPPPASSVVIFVTSQGLYYDSIVVATLPPHGRFQKLEMTAGGLQTEFGPGDPGYLGGRWWVDVNGNGRMDAEGDLFFMCPLLAPGRTTA